MVDTSKSLIVAVKSALPSLASNVTYSQAARMFLSPGYVSAAGNMYQEGLRLSRYIIVKFSIGHGYCWSFLNGIKLYIWDGKRPKLVKQKLFSSYIWSGNAARQEAVKMVKEYLKDTCRMLHLERATDSEVLRLSEALVDETENTTKLIGG